MGAAVLEAHPADRLARIVRHGYLECGIAPEVAGFSSVDADGRHRGLDVDMCRALSAAIFGEPDRVRYTPAPNVHDFLRSDDIDLVSRRLTWELQREAALPVLFGPVMFYDGQGFLVARRLGAADLPALAGLPICVEAGGAAQSALEDYFRLRGLALQQVPVAPGRGAAALADGRCTVYTADISALGALRSRLPRPADFAILPQMITKEPLAQVVRQGDDRFFELLRWTVFALIEAEELGVNSQNVDAMLGSPDPAVRRLLGIIPGNGAALGVGEKWAYAIIKRIGNYGEVFERNVGRDSPIGLERGLNRPWTDGGLMFAPPLR
jgi:general L-amino acid transport system substrate-binding protein